MSRQEICFFDVETGGLDSHRHPIIQFAAVAVALDDWRELGSLEVKVSFDENRCDPEALKLNGYDPDVWTREALPAAAARLKISNFFREHSTVEKRSKAGKAYQVARLGGHNARFDADFLTAWFKRDGDFLPAAAFEALDTLDLGRWRTLLRGDAPKDHKLGTLCAYYGIELDQAHDALADVRATAQLARVLLSGLVAA